MSDPTPASSPLAQAVQTVLDAQAQTAKLAAPAADAVKPGYKTTEFWLSAVHTICALLASSGFIPGFTDPTVKATSLGTAGVSLALYIYSRIRAKS